MTILNTCRQWLFPVEFRIAPEVWPAELIATLDQLTRVMADQTSTPKTDPEEEKKQARMFADVCTGLWRSRQKMMQPGTDRPLEEMQKVYRHFEAAWDALKQAGVDVRDHLGEQYFYGSDLDVAAFEPRPGINRETIVDTIKPTIIWNGRLIQVGQVIVGTPEKQG
jgi:hypothetical protein